MDVLLVAARGEDPQHGLYAAHEGADGWTLRQLDSAVQVAALARHPVLPLVYGVSGLDRGTLLIWDVRDVRAGAPAPRLAELDALGDIPCDLAVSPDGGQLVVASYGYEHGKGGSLTVWRLGADGLPWQDGTEVALVGSGSDPERQSVAHPHQVVFADDGLLFVPDLGAERVGRYAVGGGALRELPDLPTPTGTGPRHLVLVGDRLAVSGELSGELALGRRDPRDPSWRVARGTSSTGPVVGRWTRNYPGDVKAGEHGLVYFANRGYDTVAAIDVSGPDAPTLLAEQPAGGAWPQHLLVRDRDLLVACWDADAVTVLGVDDRGLPTPARVAFRCPGAGWLLPLPPPELP